MLKLETWKNILFEKNCLIDQGSFAMVVKGKWKKFPHYTSLNSPTIAIKMITESFAFAQRKNFQTCKLILHDEAALLLKCNEEYSVRNMIKVYGMIEGRLTADLCEFIPSAKENDEAIGIILEYFDGKTMSHFLYELKIRFSMEEKLRILCEIISTIHDLHASGIIHGDLKPQNILLSLQFPPSVKIIDFGWSKQKGYDHNFAESTLITAPNFAGTLHYCAPENNPLLAEVFHEPTRSSDIYSFAILAWEILTAKKPFPENKAQFLQVCANNQRPSLSELPSDTPVTIRELIENCWNQDRKRRFSSADCLSLIQTTYDQMKGGLFDIFFSHAWMNKNILSHVHNFLTLNGYRVWYDDHHMGYSLPKSMEKGIQDSKVVLICLNEHYQTRENCLFELKTASRLQKPIVVLLLQSNPLDWITPEVNELCDLKRKKYIDISRLIESYDWKTNDQDDDNNDFIPKSILQDLQNQISKLTKLLAYKSTSSHFSSLPIISFLSIVFFLILGFEKLFPSSIVRWKNSVDHDPNFAGNLHHCAQENNPWLALLSNKVLCIQTKESEPFVSPTESMKGSVSKKELEVIEEVTDELKELGTTDKEDSKRGLIKRGRENYEKKKYGDAVKYYRMAVELGDAGAMTNLGVCYENGQGVSQSYEEAVKYYRMAVELGDAGAMTNLGFCYENGQGVSQSYEEAVKYYQKAVELGHAGAMYNLGVCYEKGQGVSQSYEEAVKYYQKAVESGHAGAMYNLGVCYAKGHGVSQSYEEAVKYYGMAVELGDAGAMYNLGVCYAKGQGVSQSYEEAVKYYRMAVESGHAGAMYNLGVCYAKGHGVSQSYEEAVKYYGMAVELGHAGAMYNLGVCYAKGHGVSQSYEEAVELGDAGAIYNLGVCYEKGQGVSQSYEEATRLYRIISLLLVSLKDLRFFIILLSLICGFSFLVRNSNNHQVNQSYEEAVKYYRKAVGLGDAGAMYNLGVCYEKGQGVSQSYEEAVKYYRMAVELGDAGAMYNLGVCYEKGQGVSQSYEEAVKYYRMAVELGDAGAMYNLGVCYEKGQGVSQSYEEAVKYYRMAVELGNAGAMYNLGVCYAKGQGVSQSYEEAVKCWRIAVRSKKDQFMNDTFQVAEVLHFTTKKLEALVNTTDATNTNPAGLFDLMCQMDALVVELSKAAKIFPIGTTVEVNTGYKLRYFQIERFRKLINMTNSSKGAILMAQLQVDKLHQLKNPFLKGLGAPDMYEREDLNESNFSLVFSRYEFGEDLVNSIFLPFFISKYGFYFLTFEIESLMATPQLYLKNLRFWMNSIAIYTFDEIRDIKTQFIIIGTKNETVIDFEAIDQILRSQFSRCKVWSNNEFSRDSLCYLPVGKTSGQQSELLSLLDRTTELLRNAQLVGKEVSVIWIKLLEEMQNTGSSFLSFTVASSMLEQYGLAAGHLPDILSFLYENGKLIWINESGLDDVVILDPIEYLLKPVSLIFCNHYEITHGSRTRSKEICFACKRELPEDWMRMLEYGLVSEKLARAILRDYEKDRVDKVLLLMRKYELMIPIGHFSLPQRGISDLSLSRDLYYIPALAPESPNDTVFEKNNPETVDLIQRLKPRYELLQMVSQSVQFYFAFFPPSEGSEFSLHSLRSLQSDGFLPKGLFERFIGRLIGSIEEFSTEMILTHDTRFIAFKDTVRVRYHDCDVKFTNRLNENLIQIEVAEWKADIRLQIHDPLFEGLLSLLKDCYKSLDVVSLIPCNTLLEGSNEEKLFVDLASFQKAKNDQNMNFASKDGKSIPISELQRNQVAYCLWIPIQQLQTRISGSEDIQNSFQYTVFLSHDWGNKPKFMNHVRVAQINNELREKQIVTWIDTDYNRGNMRDCIAEAIAKSKIFVVFLTENYNKKVASKDTQDWCYYELNCAIFRCKYFIVAVMDEFMKNKSQWCDRLGAEFGLYLYIDMTIEGSIELLHQEILRLASLSENSVLETSTETGESICLPS